jgi:hypothetical protein
MHVRIFGWGPVHVQRTGEPGEQAGSGTLRAIVYRFFVWDRCAQASAGLGVGGAVMVSMLQ